MEMRGANGGSCRHDTPAQNSLLLQDETEEPFSIPSSLFSLPLLKCATIFSLPSACLSFSDCPRLMLSVPIQTPTSSPHVAKWPLASLKISHLLACPWNNEEADTHTILTPLCLRTATLGCRWRRSTRPQHDGARLLMPSGRAERHKPARLLWSPSGPWSSQGSAQTNDLRGHTAGHQMNSFQLSTFDVAYFFLFDKFMWTFLSEVVFWGEMLYY